MAARERHRLVFGAGLDRATGVSLVDPSAFRDLRNVDLAEGKALARRGFEERTALSFDGLGVTPMTDVPFCGSFRAVAKGLLIGYDDASRELQLFSTAVTGLNPTYEATWGLLAADAGRPLVFGAESYRKFFFAHDHGDITKRLQTVHWDGAALANLTANLDGAGSAVVKFRGVARHLNYLFGWGFGTAADPDRPEIVRASLPGQPTVFNPEHYFIVGSPAEAVLSVVSMQDFALALKGTELYRLEGYDRATFRIRPADTRYGLAGSRLWAVVNGTLHFWSLEGPRVSTGGPSEDMAIPLDLAGPDADALVEAGEVEDGFAVYRQDRRVLEYHFGQRVYELHLRDPQRPRWSYRENGVALRCAGTLFAGTAYSAAPAGHPELGAVTVGSSTISVPVNHIGALGDEVLELWLKVGAGAYTRVRNATIANLVSETIELDSLDGVTPDTLHGIAVRYRRGLAYTAGYTSSDQTTWPVASRGTVTTDPFTSAPTDFQISDQQQEPFGSKLYNSFKFTWTDGPEGTGTVLSEAEEADGSDRHQVDAVPFGVETSGFVGSYLVGPTPRLRYFFLHHIIADGTMGPLVPCVNNPVNVAGNAIP